MGTNVHAFAHRLTALSMACLASAGIIFCALSGLGCSFIEIRAFEGQNVGNTYGDVFENADTAYLGVQCLSGSDAPFYDAEGDVDRLWEYTRIFFYVGVGLGAMTTLFAWMLGSCVRPTPDRWRILSILAALSAVFQIPMFLVIESDNCNFDISRQSCALSTGAYINVASISIWIIMTIWVQCLRAPRWDEELNAWRVGENSSSPPEFVKVTEEGSTFDKELELSDGIGGDETAETMEMGIPLPRKPKKSTSSHSKHGSSQEEVPAATDVREEPLIKKVYMERINSNRYDKSVAADTGKHAVNLSQTTSQTVTSSSTNQATPGLHMSCVYSDGTREEVHLPSLSNCCLGILGDTTENDDGAKFRKYPKTSDEFDEVEYDDYGLKNTNSADFLVRRLQKEEEAAAARRAERNMAPVASFEFVSNHNRTSAALQRDGDGVYDNTAAIKDDVSEMTRGSGWASGVSEILDDTDLRHQPKDIIEDLKRKY